MSNVEWRQVRNSLKRTAENVYDTTTEMCKTFWSKYGDWIKHSGFTVTVIANPFQWKLVPWGENAHNDGWLGHNYRGYVFGWLFFIVKVWVDNDEF